MGPKLLPVYLDSEPSTAFDSQLGHLKRLLDGHADWVEPTHIDQYITNSVDAVVVPDLNGLAYRMVESFRRVDLPILVITSEFGTVSMWDWEIRDHLRRRGVDTVAPTSLHETYDICRALGVKAALKRSTMLTYLDDLGAGMQPDIFKRFFWYEQECAENIELKLGVTVEKRSFQALAARAAALPGHRVEEAWNKLAPRIPMLGLTKTAVAEAMRLYVALSDELDEVDDVIAAGINCLNESATSPTTPCLAWNLLFEERGLMWGCEADLPSMLTEYIVHKSLDVPVMMTNLYPFLMGDAALAHEKIPYFPDVTDPEDHILVAHCGYLGVVPQSFATDWTLKPSVLEIVDENAHAIDARVATGPVTIVKLTNTMESLFVAPAELTGHAQYENSDCLNGGVLRVADGFGLVERLPSHHAILASGELIRRLELVTSLLDIEMEHI